MFIFLIYGFTFKVILNNLVKLTISKWQKLYLISSDPQFNVSTRYNKLFGDIFYLDLLNFWRKGFYIYYIPYEFGTIARIILLHLKSDQVTSLLHPSLPSDDPTSLAQGSRSLLQLPLSRGLQVSILSHTKCFHFFNLHVF